SFIRFEALDGRGADLRLPWRTDRDRPARAARGQHPIRALAMKELRVQSMALTIAGLYVLGWLAALALARVFAEAMEAFKLMSVLYSVSLALVIGSHASAEERQLGTLAGQLLLPISSRRQWVVKVATAVALGMTLAVGLPASFAALDGLLDLKAAGLLEFLWQLAAVDLVVLSAGLYMSSLTTGGLRALIASLPLLFGAGVFVQFVLSWPARVLTMTMGRWTDRFSR